MKKIFSIILVVLAFAAVSCEKLLDIPQKGTVSTLEFYASDDDAQAALNDMYADFVSNVAGTQGIDNPEQVIINYSADDILASILDPEGSPLPAKYEAEKRRVIQASRLWDTYPNERRVAYILQAKYNISLKTALRDVELAKQVFKTQHTFDYDATAMWMMVPTLRHSW